MPGVAEQMQQGPFLVPKPPSPSDCAAAPAPGAPLEGPGMTLPLAIGGLAVAGAVAYFLFLR